MDQGLGLDWGSEGMGKKDIQTHTEPSSGRLCSLTEKLKHLGSSACFLYTAEQREGIVAHS